MDKKTKIIAFDVYGTILPTKGDQVKRKGLDLLLEKCKEKNLVLCTCSDANIKEVLEDFKEAGLDPRYFDEYFKIGRKGEKFYEIPKDFTPILKHYNLNPQELLVIGDRIKRDIKPAQDMGCETILVPEYKIAIYNDFDLNTLNIV